MNDCNHNLYRFFSWLYMIMPFNNCNNMILIIHVHTMTLQIDINILHENYNYRPINSILDFKIAFLQDLKNWKFLFLKENSKLPETRSKIYEDNPGLGSEQIFKAQIEGFKQQHQQPVEHDKPKVSDIPFHDLFWKLSRTRLKLHTI